MAARVNLDEDWSRLTDRILGLTLELICLLTGGRFSTLIKSGDQVTITVPPPHPLGSERRDKGQIVEVINKMMELLTGEVLIRCQDVSVYFSMEEWQYIEGHKDLYKDTMIKNAKEIKLENHPRLTSPDGSSHRNPAESWTFRTPLKDEEMLEVINTMESDLSDSEISDPEMDNGESSDSDPEYRPGQTPMRRNSVESSLFQWQRGDFKAIVHDFDSSTSGIPVGLFADEMTPLDIFRIFFPPQVMEHIARETNNYYRDLTQNTAPSPHSQLHKWTDTTPEELYVFFGISLLMVRTKKLSKDEYWSTDPLIATPQFSDYMSRNRYSLLLRLLHFNDNHLQPEGDKLFKLKPILDHLRMTFGEVFYPFQNLCIDESLTLFKSRLSCIQYRASKRHRFGIKTFLLRDCETGYVVDLIVYTGTRADIVTGREMVLSEAVVLTLMEKYLQRGHTLWIDNWYSSPKLYNHLHRNKTNVCGVVRKNRKGMPNLYKKLKKGEIELHHTSNMLAVRWLDRQEVCMLTTVHDGAMTTTRQADGQTGEERKKPDCMIDYRKNRRAIDRTDMMISSMEWMRKNCIHQKWYREMFFHLLDIAILNSHALYNLKTGKNGSLADFHLTLIRELFQNYHTPRNKRKRGQPSPADQPLRLTERHFPSAIPQTGKKGHPTRLCRVCSKTTIGERKRRESRYMCAKYPMATGVKMDEDWSYMTDRILGLTLEIICLLTGEKFPAVMKSGDQVTIMVPPPHSLTCEKKDKWMILEAIDKMMELLTGKIPIRCEDVTIDFSMEEWQYIEEHRELYQNFMMENQPPLTLTGERKSENAIEGLLVSPPEDAAVDNGVTLCSAGENSINGNSYQKAYSADRVTAPSSEEEASRQSTTDLFLCLKCGKSFLCESEFKKHRRVHVLKKRLSCSECGKSLPTKQSLLKHQKIHTQLPPFLCSECGKCFAQKSNLHKHQRIHVGKYPYSCSECGKCFLREGNFHAHQRTHTGEHPYSCSECGMGFRLKCNFRSHQKVHSGERPFSCPQCGKSFGRKQHLLGHLKSHSDDRPFTCSECGKSFTRDTGLDRHKKLHTGERPFSCSHCERTFIGKSELRLHERIHTGERPFSCSECGKRFIQKRDLQRHQKSGIHPVQKTLGDSAEVKVNQHSSLGDSVTGIIPHRDFSEPPKYDISKTEAPGTDLLHHSIESLSEPSTAIDSSTSDTECMIPLSSSCKNVPSKFSLTVHQREESKSQLPVHPGLHSADKPFSCSECAKRFMVKSLLVQHQRVHTGVRPFSCSDCGKCFSQKGNLIIHRRTHTGEKPYSCPQCGKSYIWKKQLLKHQEDHMSQHTFLCSECGKCFKQKCDLLAHQRVHTGERPFLCAECGQSFCHKSNLYTHRKIHAGEHCFS
ncbi:uncharacterized protein [Hyperolius riggenbachi]|uniref:uncharacterized protein n=1 Tax=Hyperolius riggenbachi TaxID=752182 RepID=UPI0035A2D5B2